MKIAVISGPMDGVEYLLDEAEATIGRSQDSKIWLPLDLTISRHHARLSFEKGVWWLEDTNSKNGTFIAEEKITTKIPLPVGVVFRVGHNTFLRLTYSKNDYIFPKVQIPPSMTIKEIIEPTKTVRIEPDLKPIMVGEYLTIIQQMANALRKVLNLSRLLETAMERLFEILPAERGYLFLAEGNTLFPKVIKRRDGKEQMRLNISQSILKRVVKERGAFFTTDALGELGTDSITKFSIKSIMCTPLLTEREVLGAIYLDTLVHPKAFKEGDLKILNGIASQLTTLIHNITLSERIEQGTVSKNNLQQYLPFKLIESVNKGEKKLTPEGRIKEITFLYSTIKDFTTLSKKMNPEETIEMLNEYFSEIVRIIFEHDGIIGSYIRDTIVAIFGGPIEDEKQIEKTVSGALKIQQSLKDLNEKRKEKGKETFQARIGINYGEIFQKEEELEERFQYIAINDVLNLTQHLSDYAKGDTILISESAYQKVKDKVDILSASPIKVAGKEAIPAYEVRGLKE